MRDYVVLGIIFAILPVALVRPFVGVLAWLWIAFMNPHRMSWGIARDFPVAFLIAVATLAGLVLSGEAKRIPRTAGTYALLLLWVCLTISSLLAFHPDAAGQAWEMRSKILLMVFVSLALAYDRRRLQTMLLVTALSIGFFGFKGGLFTILTGARDRVLGPEGTSIEGTNSIALGLNMILPLLFYLSYDVSRRSLRWAMRVTFVLSIFAVVGTYSRGGLLGLGIVLSLMWIKARRSALALVLTAATIAGVISLVPHGWTARMETIETYQQDGSAMGRINAWKLAWRLALARPAFGWGPEAMEDKSLYQEFYPDSTTHNDVHSAYFQLLAEDGFATFGVFLFLLVWSLASLNRLKRLSDRGVVAQWVGKYADMLQISLAAYVVSAAFLEQAFFELFYYIVGAGILLKTLATEAESVDEHAAVAGALGGVVRAQPLLPIPMTARARR